MYEVGSNLLKAEVPLSLLEQNLKDTAQILRNERNATLNELNQRLLNSHNNSSGEMMNLEQRLNNQITDTAFSIRQTIKLLAGQANQLDVDKTSQLADTAQNIRSKMFALNLESRTSLNKEVNLLNDKISGTQSAVQDTAKQLRLNFQIKLNHLEEALQDTAQVIRTSLIALNQKNRAWRQQFIRFNQPNSNKPDQKDRLFSRSSQYR